MSLEIFHTDRYKTLIQTHLHETVAYLLEQGVEFAVAAELRHILFSPELPTAITESFGDVALFVLAGYTFGSAHLDETHLYFEAGFGAENIGAELTIPLLAIKQLFVDDYPIAINVSEPMRPKAAQSTIDRSMEALLNNPENKKLLRKSKKA